MSELFDLFKKLNREQSAWDALRLLDGGEPEHFDQFRRILDDPGCDYPDDASKYAGAANEKLAISLVRVQPELLDEFGRAILQRCSQRFRRALVQRWMKRPGEAQAVFEMAVEGDVEFVDAALTGLRDALTDRVFANDPQQLYKLLVPLCHRDGVDFDVPSLMARLDREATRTDLLRDEALAIGNAQLHHVLRQIHELDADISAERLAAIYSGLAEQKEASGRVEAAREWVVRIATRKQKADYEPLLEIAAKSRQLDLQLLGLTGLVKLRLPSDPIRTSIELVGSRRIKTLAIPVRVVGFAGRYLELVGDDDWIGFIRDTPPPAFRNTLRALSALSAKSHVGRLNEILDVLGDSPQRGLKQMRAPERRRFENALARKAAGLNLARLSARIRRYVLDHQASFARLGSS